MSTANILDATLEIDAANRPPLALIAGPTASGKSDCAVRLAQELERHGRRTAIINADASQVYADLEVLSARPSPQDMGGIAHHLFGAWDGAETCSAADWAKRAGQEIEQLHREGIVPILVGGTGLYIRTLLDGIAPVPEIDPAIREEVRALPVAEAHAALMQEDPERAARLAPADTTRVARALEVVRSTGQTLSYWQQQTSGGIGADVTLFPAIILPERKALYARCDRRFDVMLERGALDEVRTLLARHLAPELPVMRAIGVPELAAYLSGTCTIDEASQRGAQATRNYAKRQFTWLRHQPPVEWIRIETENSDPKEIDEILFRRFGLT